MLWCSGDMWRCSCPVVEGGGPTMAEGQWRGCRWVILHSGNLLFICRTWSRRWNLTFLSDPAVWLISWPMTGPNSQNNLLKSKHWHPIQHCQQHFIKCRCGCYRLAQQMQLHGAICNCCTSSLKERWWGWTHVSRFTSSLLQCVTWAPWTPLHPVAAVHRAVWWLAGGKRTAEMYDSQPLLQRGECGTWTTIVDSTW